MKSRMAAAGLIWGVALLSSRLIGLVRDAVLGSVLGVTGAADVYQAAFRIPDWFSSIVAGGTLSVVFIPIFSAHLQRGEEARAWRAFSAVANAFFVLLLVVGGGFWLAVPVLADWLTEGFDAEQLALLVHLTRIVLPAQLFHILGNLVSASLLARDRHVAPAMAPLVYSVVVILGGWIGQSAEGFAWGVLLGAFLGPFLLPLVVSLRAGLRWTPTVDFADADLRTTLARFVPVMLGGSLLLVDDTFLTRFGSGLQEGSIAVLGYAKTLMKAPMGIFGQAAGYAAYSTLTRLALEHRLGELYTTTTTATRRVLVLAVLSQVGLTVAAPEFGALVYGTGRIPVARIEEMGTSLILFSAALAPWSAQALISRAFYAQGKGWIPARLVLLVMVLFTPLYAVCADRWGAPGLAGASSVAVTTSVVTLQLALKRQTGGQGGYLDLVGKLIVMAALGIGAGFLLRAALPAPTWSRMDAAWRIAATGAVGGGVFLGAGWLLRLPELHEALAPLLRRLRRSG